MKSNLQPYGDIDNITVEARVELDERKLFISFILHGKLDDYLFPKKSKPKRANELWKATCFELFLANSNEESYYELNFSSSLAWNFYYLKHYRAEVKEVKLLNEPIIEVFEEESSFKIELQLEGFGFEKFDSYNLASILLNKKNERTFWAMEHPKEKANFHQRKTFKVF